MKLIWPLVATLLYCAGVQSSAPVQQPQLTQREKNEKLFKLIEDTSDKPEDHKSIEMLKSQGAYVDREFTGNAICFWENSQLLDRLLYHDIKPEKFSSKNGFSLAFRNIEIMKILAGDTRFDITSGAEGALARELMSHAIVNQCKETVLLVRYLGLDVAIPNELGGSNLQYAHNCNLPGPRPSEKTKDILAIVTAPADKLHTFMTPEEREEFAAIKVKRNQNKLQFVLNRQMGPTYTIHQQQMRNMQIARLQAVASNHVTDDCIVDQKK